MPNQIDGSIAYLYTIAIGKLRMIVVLQAYAKPYQMQSK